jgi:hypothetical protein
MICPIGHLAPNEMICKYPEAESLGWNAAKIGTFFSAGLLRGKRKTLKSFILETSFLELLEYVDKIAGKKRGNRTRCDHLTPDELVHKYPQVINELDWNASKVGIFYSAGLLLGYRNGRECKALIVEASFMELIDYASVISLKGGSY